VQRRITHTFIRVFGAMVLLTATVMTLID